ncbi:hypothetical protein NDU88_005600 [Pleurodeles waltl]|uniref:Uncharacterized protein n=1 Tax=Pleurodeles waltl TaxID=8319 RepID=A0AAV7W8I3_PLEWA|nr:hypothetical protein NDU88_005600 [Pleurodeles waltl]
MLLEGPGSPGVTGSRQAALELRKLWREKALVSLWGNRGRVSMGMNVGALRRSAVEVVDVWKKAEPKENMVRPRGGGNVEGPAEEREEREGRRAQ